MIKFLHLIVFQQRMAVPIVRQQNTSMIRMALKVHAEHIIGFALVPLGRVRAIVGGIEIEGKQIVGGERCRQIYDRAGDVVGRREESRVERRGLGMIHVRPVEDIIARAQGECKDFRF